MPIRIIACLFYIFIVNRHDSCGQLEQNTQSNQLEKACSFQLRKKHSLDRQNKRGAKVIINVCKDAAAGQKK